MDTDHLKQQAHHSLAFGNGAAVAVPPNDLLLLIESREEALESLKEAEFENEELRHEIVFLEQDLDAAHRVIEDGE